MQTKKTIIGIPVLAVGATILLALAALVPARGETPAQQKPLARSKPNVIFILADDLGYGQLGVTGNPVIRTPNIDRLASTGAVLTSAYAGNTVCSPSRVSLLTGQDGRVRPLDSNHVNIRPDDRTLGHLMMDAGYDTALFGKWGVGQTFGETDPNAMGFETFFGLIHNISAHRQYPMMYVRNQTVVPEPENSGGRNGRTAQRAFTDKAVEYIGRERDKPFFLFLSYTTPHADLATEERFIAPYRDQYKEYPYPGWVKGSPNLRFAHAYPEPVDHPDAVIAGMVAALDAHVGEVLQALEEQGLAHQTIVIFTSDNGPHREGGANPERTGAALPYRGAKRDLFDGGIRVPMIISWPWMIAPNTEITQPVAFFDILPTLREITGAKWQGRSNGASLLPLLRNENGFPDERMLYWAFEGPRQRGEKPVSQHAQAARSSRFKAIRLNRDDPVRLFEIAVDPLEQNDVALRHPAESAAFTALFDEHLPLAESND